MVFKNEMALTEF